MKWCEVQPSVCPIISSAMVKHLIRKQFWETKQRNMKTKAKKELSCAKMLLTLHYHCQEWNVENSVEKNETLAPRTGKENSITFWLYCTHSIQSERVCMFINTFQTLKTISGSGVDNDNDNGAGNSIQPKSVRQSEYAHGHTFISNIQIKMLAKTWAKFKKNENT